MKRHWFVLAVVACFGIAACAQLPSDLAKMGGWTTLINGEEGLDNWHRVGDANWRAEDGAIVAYRGKALGRLQGWFLRRGLSDLAAV